MHQILPNRWFHCAIFFNSSFSFTLSLFHTIPTKLLILPPPSHFHTLCAAHFFCLSFSFTLSFCVCIYHSTAPNLFKFTASHSTLIHLQQKYLSHWQTSISWSKLFTPKSSCPTHCQSVVRRLDSSVTNAVVMILRISKNPSLLMFNIAFLIHTPIPNQRGNHTMDRRLFILLEPLPIHTW